MKSRWHRIPQPALYFDTEDTSLTPMLNGAGCYAIYHRGRLIYIGQSRCLIKRLRTHVNRRNMHVSRRLWTIKIRPERTAGERFALESALIKRCLISGYVRCPDAGIYSIREAKRQKRAETVAQRRIHTELVSAIAERSSGLMDMTRALTQYLRQKEET